MLIILLPRLRPIYRYYLIASRASRKYSSTRNFLFPLPAISLYSFSVLVKCAFNPQVLCLWSLKPNSITLAGSKLVRSWSLTSFEPDSVMEFGFYGNLC